MVVPWLPILTVGSTLLGSLFGDSSTEKQNQTQTSTSATAGTTKLTGGSTTTQNQSQVSNQTSNQNSSENSATGQTGSADVSRLDQQTLEQLTGQVRNLLSGAGAGSSATQDRLAEVQGADDSFDSDAYISGIMAAANDTISSGVENDLAKIESGSGGSRRSNSNTALLASKVRNQAGAQLAGVKADATARAAELARTKQESKTGQISTLASQTDASVVNLLGSLLQAGEKQTNQQSAQTATTGVTSGTTTGTTNTNTTEVGTQTQDQVQGSTQTGATKTVGSGKKTSGGGLGGIFDTIGDILGSIF